jgi:hypothetical protein
MKIKRHLLNLQQVKYYIEGRKILNDKHYLDVQKMNHIELSKRPSRTKVINFLLSLNEKDTCYLEIGVRNPSDNYDFIKADTKYSVDPGIEFKENPVDFALTSDDFFKKLSANEILSNDIKFDVIFIDGLHLAEQVDKDIYNALKYIKSNGFVVLHDCNPPTEWHARESYEFHNTPALEFWNGTTWKAFLKSRSNPAINSCCIDSDWGIGILSKGYQIGKNIELTNPFFEFKLLENNRKEYLNLIDFDSFKKIFINKTKQKKVNS